MYELDKQLKDDLGLQLSKELKACDVKVPEGFRDDVLGRIDLLENQKVRRNIVFQERLALAGCIVLPIFVMGVVVSFWDRIFGTVSAWATDIYDSSSVGVSALFSEWQLLILVLVVTAFAILFSFRGRLIESQ